jgi:nicotinate-nucleotide adenylyltransferase
VSQTLAIFGGSFDPPHVGHTLVAAYVMAAHGCDRVLVVPTGQHAFGKRLSPLAHRVRMCEMAMACLRNVEVSSIEGSLPAPNRTLHTIEAIAATYPNVQLRLVLGSDLLSETHAWHNFARVTELAPLIVIERQGHERADASSPALPAVSSTDMRRRLRAGESTASWLCPSVAAYATQHQLFTAAQRDD